MATEIAPNEGKQYVGLNVMSGRTVYAGLIYGKTVAGGTIPVTATLASIAQEETGAGSGGTPYVRQAIVLGAISGSGVIAVPSTVWNPANATDWHNNETAWFIASAASGGVFIYVWDLSATRDMAKANANLIISSLNWFYKNPGE